jgi:hypothetical protein
MLLFPLLSRVALFGLLAGSAFAQGWTDGFITVESGANVRSNINSPALPPNSTEISIDSGFYTGYSRNLQNAAIQPGWSYSAHAVTLTPPPTAQGLLLEVRYVAVSQWGAQRDFDVVLRDATSGSVVATLLQQTAVLDSQNWQVIDVSALNFVVGAADFVVELRPSSSCSGDNGFTIAYSGVSNANSKFSSMCSDFFADFAADPRELFLRAVVENGGSPGVTVSSAIAGLPTTLTAYNLTANNQAIIGYSFAGAGPVMTGFGSLALSLPIGRITVNSDASGAGSAQINLPSSLTGATVWLQVVDLASGDLGNGVEVLIQ